MLANVRKQARSYGDSSKPVQAADGKQVHIGLADSAVAHPPESLPFQANSHVLRDVVLQSRSQGKGSTVVVPLEARAHFAVGTPEEHAQFADNAELIGDGHGSGAGQLQPPGIDVRRGGDAEKGSVGVGRAQIDERAFGPQILVELVAAENLAGKLRLVAASWRCRESRIEGAAEIQASRRTQTATDIPAPAA